MKVDLTKKGTWVTIYLSRDRRIEGWLVGGIPEGLLVAVTDDEADIRLVTDYTAVSINYQKRHPRLFSDAAKETADELERVNQSIAGPLRRALSRLDFSTLHDCGHKAAELERQIDRSDRVDWRGASVGLLDDELTQFLMAQADRSTSLHRDAYGTFEASGLADVIEEHGPRLAAFPPQSTLPAFDLEFVPRETLTRSLESARDNRWSTERHSVSLDSAENMREQLLTGRLRPRGVSEEPKAEKPDDSTRFSRWFGPSLRILAGTGLATANAALGITAGLTATITTIGATAVPIYVGVATSIYTGLTQVADGLEKIGRRK